LNIFTKLFLLFPLICLGNTYFKTEKFSEPKIEYFKNEGYVSLGEDSPDLMPGTPYLPMRYSTIEIPEDEEVVSVSLKSEKEKYLQDIAFPLFICQFLSTENFTPPKALPSFDTKNNFPLTSVGSFGINRENGKKIVFVKIYPVCYNASQLKIFGREEITYVLETSKKTPQLISKAINPVLSRGDYRYLIITTNSFLNINNEFNINKLLQYRASQGYTTNVVSVDWIYENFPGRDPSEKVRNFLKEAYEYWGTEYLLIAGGFRIVPVNKVHFSMGIMSGTYYADFPSDYAYYGCLDGDYDFNQNNLYGEWNDGINGGRVDLSPELKVGRLPAITADELCIMIRKTILKEENKDCSINGFTGEYMSDTHYYSSDLMEGLRKGLTKYSYHSYGFTESTMSNDFTDFKTLYESPTNGFSVTEMLPFLNQNMTTLNSFGHGARNVAFKMVGYPNNFLSFTNTQHYVACSLACEPGMFDSEDRCFAEFMLISSNCASSVLMNSRLGWYEPSSYYGSMRQQRSIWDYLIREESLTLGDAMILCKNFNFRTMSGYSYDPWYYVHFSFCLFGDPASMPFRGAATTKCKIENPTILSTESNCVFSFQPVPSGLFATNSVKLIWKNHSTLHTDSLDVVSGGVFSKTINKTELNPIQSYTFTVTSFAGNLTTNAGVINTGALYNFIHTPLGDVLNYPGPYSVSVSSENGYEGNINLYYRSNTNIWSTIALSNSNNLYVGNFMPNSKNGESFQYFIMGSGDSVSHITNIVTCFISYSELRTYGITNIDKEVNSFYVKYFTVTNFGNSPLSWDILYSFNDNFNTSNRWNLNNWYRESDYVKNTNNVNYLLGTNFLLDVNCTLKFLSKLSETGTVSLSSGTNIYNFSIMPSINWISNSVPISGFGNRIKFTKSYDFSFRAKGMLKNFELSGVKKPKGYAVLLGKNDFILNPLQGKKVMIGNFSVLMKNKQENVTATIIADDWNTSTTQFLWKVTKP